MEVLTCQIKEYIQPFERSLALQELHVLANGPIVPVDGDEATASIFSISRTSDVDSLRTSLAYWQSVGDDTDGLTTQVRGEATAKIARAQGAWRKAAGRRSCASAPELAGPAIPALRDARAA